MDVVFIMFIIVKMLSIVISFELSIKELYNRLVFEI